VAKKASTKKVKKPAKGGPRAKTGSGTAAKAKAKGRKSTSPRPAGKAKRPAVKRHPGKTRLKRADLNQFRDMLLEKKRSLIGDMNGIEAEALGFNRQSGTGDLSNMPTHPADIGTDNYEQEFTLGLLESERNLLGEINEALQRVADGTYGICQGTGKAITKARLRARPWSKYSIEYAKMIESGLVNPDMEDQDAFAFDPGEHANDDSPPARKQRPAASTKRKKK